MRISYTVIISALLFFILNACSSVLQPGITYEELLDQRSSEVKAIAGKADTITCIPDSKIRLDQYILHNNLWGKQRLKDKPHTLCSFHAENGFGWQWQMPANSKGVIAYPAVQFGPGPWQVQEKMHGFPLRLDSISHLKADYSTEMYVKGKKYNLAFDLWLSSEFNSRPGTVTTEIMVWEDYYDFRSFGKKTDQISTPFGIYDVMKGYLKNEEFGQDWQYFAFIRKTKRQQGTVDLQFLLKYLTENHGIDPKQYLTSVEFGNEIGNSSGFTLVKKFNLTLK